MKRKIAKIISMVMSAALIFGCGMAVSAGTKGKPDIKNDVKVSEETDAADTEDLKNIISMDDVDKEETVYVIAEADGSVKKVIVSELLKNPNKLGELADVTGLSDIINVKSDAAYTMSGTSCVWNAEGEDIYYRGTTTEEVPVLLEISFKLDGKSVSADEIAGKSGELEMTINYVNNCKRTVEIDGKEEEICVPFLMISGMILDNDNFKHVTVDNGKVIDDGDKTIVAGFALPGLKENLALDEDIDIPSSITIKADVTDFKLSTTLTLATNDIFNKIDIDGADTIDELEEQLDLLDSSMKKIVDGSSELYGYMTQLLDKSGELVQGIKTLDDYANQMSESVDKLYNEAIVYIDGKLVELSSGLNEISGHSTELNGGAKQVYDTLISTVQSQLDSAGLDALGIEVPTLTMENYASELDKLVKALDENAVREYATQAANKIVTAEVNKNESTIRTEVTKVVREQVTAAVREQVTATVRENVVKPQVLASQGLTEEQYGVLPESSKAAIDAAISAQMATDAVKAAVDAQMESDAVKATIDAQMNSENIKKTIDDNVSAQKQKLIEENMAGTEVQSQIAAAVASAKTGAASIKSAKESLDAYKTFYEGVLGYTAGVDAAADGCAQISQGYTDNVTANVKTLSDKLKEYVAGIDKLNESAPMLEDAVSQITDGAKTLADGTSQFYNEGIKGIIDKTDDIAPVITRLRATLDVSKDYQSFGGISENMTGSTKFIYRTEAIEQ